MEKIMAKYFCYISIDSELNDELARFLIEAESAEAALNEAIRTAKDRAEIAYWDLEYYGPCPETFNIILAINLIVYERHDEDIIWSEDFVSRTKKK